MKAVRVTVLLIVFVAVVVLRVRLITPEPHRLGTPVGCGVLTRDYPYDNCTPRPS
jgi:hypothetical protein